MQKLIAGPEVFICDECVDLCTGIVEPDDDKELFRLMKGNEETGGRADPALFELARGASTEELAHYVERGRKAWSVTASPCRVFSADLRYGTTKCLQAPISRRYPAT